ncbi:hypothetical protein SC206_19090 [Rouxiella sp. T17]|uniref:hypothetical protein n=1 Tax=Rouxiella sp. T17 TaxID=3085684 RepID=UPI002FC9E482
MFSNNIKIDTFVLTDNAPLFSNQSWTGELITRSTGVQYYSISFQVNLHTRSRQELQQFIAQYGQGAPFEMSLGWYSTYTGAQTGAIAASKAAGANTYQISVAAGNKIEVGSIIQFTNHKKLYKVIANTGSVLSIFPNLKQPVQVGENIKYNALTGMFKLQMDNNAYATPSENLIQMTFKAIEDVTA